jgi:hypothetical protein
MQKKTLSLVIFILLATVTLSFARLGETLDQCKARYGFPTGQNGENEFIFSRDHMVIVVHFRAGRSVREDYGPEAGGVLSEAQVSTIFDENAEGSTAQ